jgi:hypothetical protein
MAILPERFEMKQVNAILAASDGTVYLACGKPDTPAYVVRDAPGEERVIEEVFEDLRLFALAETADGRILAGGLEPGTPVGAPILLQR